MSFLRPPHILALGGKGGAQKRTPPLEAPQTL